MAGSAGSKYGIIGDDLPVTAKGKVMDKLEPLKKSILDKDYIVTMPDGSRWAIPVRVIAEHRAKFYVKEFGNDIFMSMAEDTVPLFESYEHEIKKWACNQMNWSDVYSFAVKLSDDGIDFNEGWNNGKAEIE